MNQQSTADNYDAHIIPSETAARKEREGEGFKHKPESEESQESIDTTGGYTVDGEGLANNYAVEPEMYVEVPGDLREEEQAQAAARSQDRLEVNETNEMGKLTDTGDQRGKGTGII
jgi:hypothetical protein